MTITVCLIIEGSFPVLRKETNVLLAFSLRTVPLALNVGPVCTARVVVPIVPRLPGAKVCKVRRM